MASLHGFAAQVVLVLAIVGTVWVVWLALARRTGGSMLYGELVWVAAAIAVTGLIGLLVALTAAPPKDPLHVLYGLLAGSVLPGAALVLRDQAPRRRITVLAVALVVLVILVVRLFQTGG